MLAQIAKIFISPIFISVLALLISLMTLIFRLKAKKSTVMYELTQQANLINDSTAPYGIRGPYAVLKGLPSFEKDKIREFEALSATFFHHVNLLSIVYHNRRILGKKVFNGYLKWIKTVFRPWLESDDILLWHWKKTKETEDLLGKKFIDWLDQELGIHKEAAN